jgi:hypothetical protein
MFIILLIRVVVEEEQRSANGVAYKLRFIDRGKCKVWIFNSFSLGLPDFSGYKIPKREKYTKWPPKGRKQTKRQLNLLTSSITRTYTCKIDPNWDFWFENIPSIQPAPRLNVERLNVEILNV